MTLTPFMSAELTRYCSPRPGEFRLGEQIQLAATATALSEQLQLAKHQGCKFVLLGVPEDIGPRANLGCPGADSGWQAFLAKFLNLQSNAFIDANSILLLGEVNCTDLQQQAATLVSSEPEQLAQLRALVSELDQRVYAIVREIFAADLLPVVIGGGHNNSYPLLKALSLQLQQPVNAANLDPHSDFRPLEGRHSGNGFSYAHADGYLQHYYVLGLHEFKNSAATLAQLHSANAEYCSYQRIFVRQEVSFEQALDKCVEFVLRENNAIGIELDTDSISMMPVSAFTNCGISVQAAEQFVFQLAKLPGSRYLHLAEAAPLQHPAGFKAGCNEAGQVLSALVLAFIQGKQSQPQAI